MNNTYKITLILGLICLCFINELTLQFLDPNPPLSDVVKSIVRIFNFIIIVLIFTAKKIISWIRIYVSIRIVVVNFIVLVILLFSIELINFSYQQNNKKNCNYDWILYSYCPNITISKKNVEKDGGELIYNYSNNIGQRVRSLNSKSISNVDNVFIGDSFIQADEIDYDLTFYGQLEKLNYKVSAFGYSSWNVIQYHDAIKKLSLKNTNYHVFLMPNDITPSYYRSVYQENRSKIYPKENFNTETGLLGNLKSIFDNSLIKKLLYAIFKKFNSSSNILIPINLDEFNIYKVEECLSLESINEEYKEKLGYDYLIYSKSPICWGEEYKVAAQEALIELTKLQMFVKKLNSELTVYMIPPGWSFANENTNGRKNNNSYFFNNSMSVTTEPLLEYFANSMPSVKFVSLELLISEWVSECDECIDKYYFSNNGHWTKETHKRLSKYFANTLNFSNR